MILMRHTWKLDGLIRGSPGPLTLKGSKQVCSIYPSLGNVKGQKTKAIIRDLISSP